MIIKQQSQNESFCNLFRRHQPFRYSGFADVQKKLLTGHFEDKLAGRKNYELRIEDDWKFEVGQTIKYREVDYDFHYTGRFIVVEVVSIIRNIPGLEKGYCLMGDKTITRGSHIL